MNVNELKNKVLQLAIQGKLVEQNPEDTSASVLLEEIRKEKEQLIKDKKIKKEKALPEITDEEKPFKLPNGWEFVRLGDFIRFVGGNQPPKSTFKYEDTDGYIRLIQIRDYKSDSHITFIPYEKAKKFCSKDDVMIGRYGPPIFQILRGIEGAYNVALMKADPISGIEKDYLYYLLKDSILLKKLEFLASRTCGQDGIDMDTLKSYVVALPPKEEQLRIVSKLESMYKIIDELNENKEAMLNDISNSRNKVLWLAMQGKLVNQREDNETALKLLEKINTQREKLIKNNATKKQKGFTGINEVEKPFSLPNGWEWCRLGEVILLSENLNIQSKLNQNEMINYLDIDSIDNKKQKVKESKLEPVSNLSSRARRVLTKDTIVYSMVRPYLKNIAIIMEDKKNYIGSTGFVAFKSILIEKEYIFNYLRSEYVTNKLNGYIIGFNSPSINLEQFCNLEIPIPPLEEQKRIVKKVDEIMSYLDELEKTILNKDII